MSNNSSTKKRRVGGGGARVSIDGAGESGEGSELAAIKSMMQELVQQNRTQTNMMQSMQGKINNMQAEITQLTNKCDKTGTIISKLDDKLDVLEGSQKRVEDKLKYHDILLQNQNWKYSAPYPSRDYWSSSNLNGDDRAAKDFLRQIQQCTEKMRYGKGDGDILLTANLPYNQVFLPHWKEFANALQQYHYHLNHSTELQGNSGLYFLNVKLPDEVIDLLSKALKSSHFRKIKLESNNFGQRGIDFALKYLKNNPILKAFSLVDNPINSMDDINKLGEIVKEHPAIRDLQLHRCQGADVDGYEMLKMIMNAGKNKLMLVDLSSNNISTGESTFISDILVTNPLYALLLAGNKLDDQDAISIAEALKHNTNLRFLDLTRNSITKTGWMALRKAEFDDTSLNAAADSNHRCNIKYPLSWYTPVGVSRLGIDMSEMNGDRNQTKAFNSKCVRKKKIYTILSSRNRDCTNVGHFEGIPVEILPDMLHSIQNYSNYQVGDSNMSQGSGDVKPLSIVYEICRHWDESLAAFEALSS